MGLDRPVMGLDRPIMGLNRPVMELDLPNMGLDRGSPYYGTGSIVGLDWIARSPYLLWIGLPCCWVFGTACRAVACTLLLREEKHQVVTVR
jgi:hypothetical protein